MKASIKVIPWPGIDNAYIVISSHKSEQTGNGVTQKISLLYATEDKGAEWAPEHGPITVLTPCGADNTQAKKHWFYDYITGWGDWSQLAVDREGLPEKFLAGDDAGIFEVLRRCTISNKD